MIIVGEKINATLPSVSRIIEKRDGKELAALARAQAEAGADYIDVNVGTGRGAQSDEVDAVRWAVAAVQEVVSTPICVDSADPAVIRAGLEAANGKPPLINSVKAEEALLGEVVPKAAEHRAKLVAMAMDEKGIPASVGQRVNACEKIARVCEDAGLPLENVYFDPLVMPVGADYRSGKLTLDTLAAVKKAFPKSGTITGLSNVSFGLPRRRRLNTAFLFMCICAGLDAAILDPLDDALMAAVTTGEVLVGKDRYCRRYTRMFREQG